MNMTALAQCTVLTADGEKVVLSTMWKDQTVMFVFLRHFGCVACHAQATQVWNDRHIYENNGIKIVFIGNGTPAYLKKFQKKFDLVDALIFTDPTLESFLHAGFRKGFLALVNPDSGINGLRLLRKGYKQGSFDKESGVHWQLGGVLVVHPDSTTGYHYISHALGDFPPEKDLLKASEQPSIPAAVSNIKPR